VTSEEANEFIKMILKSVDPEIKSFLEDILRKLGKIMRVCDSYGLLEAFHLELPPLPEEIFMIELGLHPDIQM